jgi:hypothetical protein
MRLRSLVLALLGLALALALALGQPANQQSIMPTDPQPVANPGTHGGGGG